MTSHIHVDLLFFCRFWIQTFPVHFDSNRKLSHVLQRMRSAILLVILSKGLDPQSVRLAMDGTAARIERMLRSMGMEPELPQPNESVEPRAALPSSSDPSGVEPPRSEAERLGDFPENSGA